MHRRVVLFFMLQIVAQVCFAESPETTLHLYGHVVYRDGSPVRDAKVSVFFYYEATTGIEVTAQTDIYGTFDLPTHAGGEGIITASKEEEGYPDYKLLMYGRAENESVSKINIVTNHPIKNITLRFGEPLAVVRFIVLDATTHEAITSAVIQARLKSEPNVISSSTVLQDGSHTFVLPSVPVLINVSAKGYSPSTFTVGTPASSFFAEPGIRKDQTVLLMKKE